MHIERYKCERCGGYSFDVHFPPWIDTLVGLVDDLANFGGVQDPDIWKLTYRIADVLALAAKETFPGASDKDETTEPYPWVTLHCATCPDQQSGPKPEISEEIWQELSRKQMELEKKYCTEALGINCPELYQMLTCRAWKQLVDDVLQRDHPQEYAHIARVQSLAQAFAPERGGGEEFDYSAWLYLLTAVASGIATNFVYDLMKNAVLRVYHRLRKVHEKRVVRRARYELSKIDAYQLTAKERAPDAYTTDVFAIIASMPLKKRRKLIEDIAIQHAKNVKKALQNAARVSPPHA